MGLRKAVNTLPESMNTLLESVNTLLESVNTLPGVNEYTPESQ